MRSRIDNLPPLSCNVVISRSRTLLLCPLEFMVQESVRLPPAMCRDECGPHASVPAKQRNLFFRPGRVLSDFFAALDLFPPWRTPPRGVVAWSLRPLMRHITLTFRSAIGVIRNRTVFSC